MREMFSFGSNILLISIISALYKNFYNLIIGKNYSETILGYYTNAEQYSSMPSITISGVTSKVSYPVLSEIQNDDVRLKSSISKLIKTVMYLSCIVMFGLTAVAKPLFFILFGEKWLHSVPIFQALCLAYVISPMHAINHNIMKVKGRADLFRKTEIIKYLLFTPIFFLGVFYGLKVLIAGIIIFYWMGFIVNAMYSKKLINYSIWSQLRDFLPEMIIIGALAILIFSIGILWNLNNITLLLIQGILYLILLIFLSKVFKFSSYQELLEIANNKINLKNLEKSNNLSQIS
jgi:O-antigen/teichoic acid export membrane protein